MAFNRRRTRSQNDRSSILRQQKKWLGENRDEDPTELKDGEVAVLENAICLGSTVEERPGSWIHSTNEMLAGTVYGKIFHKGSKRWLFHIGSQLFWSDLSCDTLTEVKDYANASLGECGFASGHTLMREFQDGILLNSNSPENMGLMFVRIAEVEPRFFNMTAPCPISEWVAFTNDTAARLYRYRYLYTFSRIEDGGTNTADRQTGGRLIHESGSRTLLNDDGVDYFEIAIDAQIQETFPDIDLHEIVTNRIPSDYVGESAAHWTHISIYRTLDIGSDFGTDLKTGEVNDPELYIWVADLHIPVTPSSTFTDGISDEALRARISSTDGASAFVLKNRGAFPIGCDAKYDDAPLVPVISHFNSSPGFLLAVQNGKKTKVDYCQLDAPQNAGYHNPLQNKKFTQEVNAIQIYQNLAVFCHTSSMSGGDLNAYLDKGLSGSPMFTLESFYPLDPVNGVTDYATIAETENGRFIALCSDKSIRIFGGVRFGDDLAGNKISREILKKAVTHGAVGKFFRGAYLLAFSNSITGANNERCIRLAIQESSGYGWSEYFDFVKAHKFHFGEVIVDDYGMHRLIAQDADDGFLYEIETYDGPVGSNVFRSVRDKADKADLSVGEDIVSRIRLPDYTGELESFLCVHQVTNAYTRPRLPYNAANPSYTQNEDGFAENFSLDVNAYENGELSDEITGAPVTGDLEFYKPPKANRIAIEFVMNAGGWSMVRSDTRFRVIDQKKTQGINDTNEAAYMAELESGRELWLSRGKDLDLERCIGRKYAMGDSVTGSFSGITGPDGEEESAIAFSSAGGSFFVGPPALVQVWLEPVILDGDFTFSFWYKAAEDGFVAGNIISGIDSGSRQMLGVSLSTPTSLLVSPFGETVIVDDVNNGEWHFFMVRKTDGLVEVFQGENLRASFDGSSFELIANGDLTIIGSLSCSIFDMCLYSESKSDLAMQFYRDDVIDNNGKKVLPYF